MEGFADPLGYGVETALAAEFFPAGFPVRIATNRKAVLEAAAESWGRCTRGRECAPMEVRIAVTEGGDETPPAPVFRGMGHVILLVSDRANCGVLDYRRRSAFCWIGSAALRDRAWFRWFFLEAMAYTLISQCEAAAVHGACVARGGRGVLLCGASGSGKSTLAYVCARRGWTFVSDDAVLLPWNGSPGLAVGYPHRVRFRPEALERFPELEEGRRGVRPNGKLDLEVQTAALDAFQTARECVVEQVVFLRREAGGRGELTPLAPAEVLRRLKREMPLYDGPVMRRHMKVVNELLRIPGFELRYTEAVEAAERLEGLHETGRKPEAAVPRYGI